MSKQIKVFFVILVAVLCVSAIPKTSYAADEVASGTCGAEGDGSNVTWTLHSDGALTISGEGAMASYPKADSVPWKDYYDSILSVVVENGVTTVSGRASGHNVTSITIPESVTMIDVDLFYNKQDLSILYYNAKNASYKSTLFPDSHYNFYDAGINTDGIEVIIGEDVERIPAGLFFTKSHYANIKKITIGSNVQFIGANAFKGLNHLSSIEYNARCISDLRSVDQVFYNAGTASEGIEISFGASVEVIPDYLFYADKCPKLSRIIIGEDVNRIGAYAFSNVTGFEELVIPVGVRAIAENAFSGCIDLVNLTIPSGVDIGKSAFAGCTGLASLAIPEYVTLGESAFSNCSSLRTVEMPNTATSISNGLFSGCTNLSVVSISSSVKKIGANAFTGCSSLINLTIPDSVEEIGDYAFDGCSNLERLAIGENITDVGIQAFANCSSLIDIIYNTNITVTADSKIFYNSGSDNGLSVVFGNSVETIPDYLFYVEYNKNSNLTSVQIGNGVRTIGKSAFSGCKRLSSLTIPNNVSSISNNAFYYCTGLNNVVISEGVTDIGGGAFSYCVRLISITIPDSVTSIGSNAFSNCTGLTSITIPKNVSSIGSGILSGCTGITEINYNARNVSGSYSSTNYIFKGAGASSDVKVTIGPDVELIPSYLFYQMTGITEIIYNARTVADLTDSSNVFYGVGTSEKGVSVTVGDSVKSIPADLFYSSANINNVTLGNNVKNIGSVAFGRCNGLTEVNIPKGVTSIGSLAFYYCPNLTKVTIPENVASIGSYAFMECRKLTDINYNTKNITSLGDDVFRYAGLSGDGITVCFGESVESIPEDLFYCSANNGINIKKAVFSGDRPDFGQHSFNRLAFDGYYPYGNSTWDGVSSNVGNGTINWSPYSLGEPVRITVIELPNKTNYIRDESIDLTGLIISVEFSDGCVESHSYSDIKTVAADLSKIGTRTVSVGYGGLTAVFNISVWDEVFVQADSSGYPESPHPYLSNIEETYSYSYPGASKLQITFSNSTEVEFQTDYLYIYDGAGNEIASYTSNQAAGQTVTVVGNSFSIKLTSDDAYETYGFSIDRIVATILVDHCEEHSWEAPIYTWSDDNNMITATRSCSNCSDIETETVTAASTTTATCTESGVTTYVAKFENEAFEDQTKSETVAALGHTEGAVHEHEVAATCTTAGSYDEVVYCTVCDAELSRTAKTIAALGHDLLHHNAKAATCTEIGWNEYDTCSRCDYTTFAEIPAKGHTAGAVVHENEVAATCTASGSYDEVVYCTVCDAELSRTAKTIAALGHDLVHHSAKAATCTENGWNAYDTCSRCDYTTYAEIPAKGHTAGAAVHENEIPATYDAGGSYDEVVYCTVCNAELSRVHKTTDKINYATYVGISLSLKGDLSMNFYIDGKEGWTVDINYEKENAEQRTVRLDKSIYNSGNKAYRIVFTGIAAKEMTDRVTLVVRDENGNQLKILRKTTGEFLESDLVEYSVATWAINKLADPATEQQEKDLAMALLNYGQAAQENFKNYNLPAKPANPNGYLAAEMAKSAASFIDTAYDKIVPDNAKDLVSYKGASLILKGALSVRVYFTEPVSAKLKTVDENGNVKYTPLALSHNSTGYYVEKTSVPSKDLDEMWTFVIEKDGKTCTIQYSALSWCNSKLANKDTSPQEINICKALYLYNKAANAYF